MLDHREMVGKEIGRVHAEAAISITIVRAPERQQTPAGARHLAGDEEPAQAIHHHPVHRHVGGQPVTSMFERVRHRRVTR
jgi:hypothetical protein